MTHHPTFSVDTILIDLDGTLVDTAPDLLAAANAVLSTLDRRPLTLQELRAMVGQGLRAMLTHGLKATGEFSETLLDAVFQPCFDYYRDNISVHSRPFEGAEALLADLKSAGFKIGVCSNKPEALCRPLLRDLHLDPYLDDIAGGDTFPYKKPDPRHPIMQLERMGGVHGLLIGDSTADTGAARQAGIPSIAVSYGYLSGPVETLCADVIIDHLSRVPDLVTRHQ